eukprot:5136214-Prymnesium_polylepis.1
MCEEFGVEFDQIATKLSPAAFVVSTLCDGSAAEPLCLCAVALADRVTFSVSREGMSPFARYRRTDGDATTITNANQPATNSRMGHSAKYGCGTNTLSIYGQEAVV